MQVILKELHGLQTKGVGGGEAELWDRCTVREEEVLSPWDWLWATVQKVHA